MLRTVWGLRCYFSILQIGSDVCLMLIVCEQCYWCIDNWFWHLSTIEDRWWAPWHKLVSVIGAFCQLVLTSATTGNASCWGGVCLGICTSLPRRGFVTDLLFGACVCIPFVSVALCCLMQNGKFRFNSLRKILAMESWLTKKKHFFLDNI